MLNWIMSMHCHRMLLAPLHKDGGLHDGGMLLKAFSSLQASNDLRNECLKEMPDLTVHAPASGETIDLNLAAAAHQLKLSAGLLQSITLHSPPDQKQGDARHRNFWVAWVDGTVVQHQGQVGLALLLLVSEAAITSNCVLL